MSFIQNNVLLSVGILLLLVFIEGIIICVLYAQLKEKPKGKGKNKRGFVPKEEYNKLEEELRLARSKASQSKKALENSLKKSDKQEIKRLENIIYNKDSEINRLNERIIDLTRENNELNEMAKHEHPALNNPFKNVMVTSTHNNSNVELKEEPTEDAEKESPQPSAQDVASTEDALEANTSKEDLKVESSKEGTAVGPTKEESIVEPPKEKIMYASFPRSANNKIYFSDLSDNIVDDSYFELKVTIDSGQATFKPLDFMKIRNYDPAMAAMLTEGVKPNVASTVLGIERGKAHREGKDWIIDNLAKIKLA